MYTLAMLHEVIMVMMGISYKVVCGYLVSHCVIDSTVCG